MQCWRGFASDVDRRLTALHSLINDSLLSSPKNRFRHTWAFAPEATKRIARMLSYNLLKNNAGLLLIGDYTSFRALHEVVHDINERSPLIKDREGLFLSFAYDVRKAYEQQREILQPPEHYDEMGVRYGVQQILPVIMLQSRMMRASLAYFDHSKMHQAMTYALEDVLENAVRHIFKADAQAIIDRWQWINLADPSIFELLYGRAGLFCSWSKGERRRRFLNLLESFDPMYETTYRYRFQNGEQGLPTLGEFTIFEGLEWPDPKW